MRYTDEAKELIRKVWDGREVGTHGWMPSENRWMTVEPFEDEEGDYLIVSLCNHVDDLGYPLGPCWDIDFLREEMVLALEG